MSITGETALGDVDILLGGIARQVQVEADLVADALRSDRELGWRLWAAKATTGDWRGVYLRQAQPGASPGIVQGMTGHVAAGARQVASDLAP